MLKRHYRQTRKVQTGMTELSFKEDHYEAAYESLCLRSVFQPIFSIAHRKAVGYEGLVRAADVSGNPVTPQELMRKNTASDQQLILDRTCRLLHACNFSQHPANDAWLFLNLNSQCLISERPDIGFMQTLMRESDLPSRRIVIEILESEIDNRDYLRELITHFRQMGCLIAIDDFGAGHSNFDRIWDLQPDIVKIDRSLVKKAGHSMKVERILTGIVSLIHETGSLVVIEGVETEKEALVAISSNADMVQGFYFAKPKPDLQQEIDFGQAMDKLLHQHQNVRSQYNRKLQQHFRTFELIFEKELDAFKQGASFEDCGHALFDDARAVRCYLLDESGYQIGRSLNSPKYTAKLDIRFTPLLSGVNANWSHRHYHFRAIQNPNMTQISRPYLSVAGSHMCITVSQAVVVSGKTYVFCCDLDWPDEDQPNS